MRKIILIATTIVLCMILFAIPSFAASSSEAKDKETEAYVTEIAEEWLQNNYQDFYTIRNIKTSIIDRDIKNGDNSYTVALSCETKYLFEKVEDIPFVKGMLSECDSRDLKDYEIAAVNNQINQIGEDAFYEEWSELNVDVVVDIDKNNKKDYSLYYIEGVTGSKNDINELQLDYETLFESGRETAAELIKNATQDETGKGYVLYDRFAARNYTRQYTSNPTSCNICNGACIYLVNTAKWNTSQYPYFSDFKHNDCADFVSQALSVGGIPEKTSGNNQWYRTKKGAYKTWSSSWTVVEDLKEYMSTYRLYWDSSTFAKANAGNILITNSGGHVVMIDYNDGTTHKFNGHTNDRYKYVFGNTTGFQYYVINRN